MRKRKRARKGKRTGTGTGAETSPKAEAEAGAEAGEDAPYTRPVGKVCPWCLEPLRLSERKAVRCPRCDRSLVDDAGRELRPIDLRYDSTVAQQQERFPQVLMIGGAIVLVIAIGLSTLHLAAVAAAPLIVVAHLVAVRLWLVRDAMRLLGPARKRFVRWLSRLGFLWIGIPGYGLAAVPLVGIAPAVATFAGLTAAVHAYTGWSLTREFDRAPLAGWEKALLWILALATLAALIGLAALVALLGWSAAAIAEWVSTR